MSTKESDIILIQKIKEGSNQALEELFAKYYHVLCQFVYKIINDIHFSEEIVSDVFLKIWNKRQEINIQTNLRAYLYKMARNHALDHLKQRPLHKSFNDSDDSLLKIPSDLDAERTIELEEFIEQVEQILNTLPPQRQLIFRLNRLEGFKYQEIAEILNISVSSVQNQMVKAVKHLGEYYRRLKSLEIFLLLAILIL